MNSDPTQDPDIELGLSPFAPELPRTAAVRRRIERAAYELFLQRSVSEVAVEEIAEAAGVSRRTFFRYCPTRDDVLAMAFVRPAAVNIGKLRDRPAEEGLVAGWLHIIRSSPLWDDAEHADLFARVMIKRQDHFRRAMERATKLTLPLLTEVIAFRLRQVGQSPDAAGAISATLLCVNADAFSKWCERGFTGDFASLLETNLRAVCQSVCLDCEE